MYDVLLNAWLILRSRWLRTLSCGLGVALGCTVFVMALGLGQTAQAQVSDRFDVFRATTVSASFRSDAGVTALPEERIPAAGVARVRTMPGVIDAGRFTALSGQPVIVRARVPGTTDAEPVSVNLLLADPHLFAAAHAAVAGHSFTSVDERVQRHVAVVGAALARELGLTAGQSTLSIKGLHVQVIGVIESTHRMPELLNSVVLPEGLAAAALRNSPGDRVDTGVLVATRPGAPRVVGDRLALALLPTAPSTLGVQVPEDPSRLRLQVSADLRRLSLAAAAVVLVGGVFAIANLMQLNVSQRVREFGLRRAVGAKRWQVVTQVLSEATIIGLVAGVAGSTLGVWALLGVCIWQTWTPVLDIGAVGFGVVAGTLGGAVGGLIPAMLAARIAPASALRL